ncbi:MAG: M23 family metallopeptidase, partial [Kiritimatiellaeota bacterium]|nr:M23 family metallopeptidase [Kiritimatiellota bacterium]
MQTNIIFLRPLLGAAIAALLLAGCQSEAPLPPPQPITLPEPVTPTQTHLPPRPPPPVWQDLVFPTAQTGLLSGNLHVFTPANPAHLDSGLFGTVRTGAKGQSRFHEGVDIAPLQRDRHGEPTDAVRSVASGVVGYASGVAGNSNYGKYVVVLHSDPVGAVYTLYAHLASITVKPGQPVQAGTTIGIMGHTSSSAIPRERAHVHFEVGLLGNERFALWYRAQKLKPDHGNFHGQNLSGVDPIAFLRWQRAQPAGSFRDFLATQPAAFSVALTPAHALDFFRRYPSLWEGERPREPFPAGTAVVLSCAENGLVLKGRLATDTER